MFKKKYDQDDSNGTIQAIINFAMGVKLGRQFTHLEERGKQSFSERQLYLHIKG